MTKSAALLIAVAVSAPCLISCNRTKVETRPTIQYVRDILANRNDREALILQQCQKVQRQASITLIGNEDDCMYLADAFLESDVRDNVDASFNPDGLPDFAGETVAVIHEDIPYGKILEKEGPERFRERVVRTVIAALDTVLHISPYDIGGISAKPSSKLIVLADPLLAEHAAFDVDTLFRSTGCEVKVVSCVDLCADLIRNEFPGRTPNVLELRDSTFASDIRLLLDNFALSGKTGTVDAILIDSPEVDVTSVKTQVADLMSVLNESSVRYGRLLSKDIVVLDVSDVLVSSCYGIMRSDNLFTHNIAAPRMEAYRVVPDPSEGTSIMLIPAHVQK